MIGIDEKTLKKSVKIYLSNINEGFSRFKYKNLEEKEGIEGDFTNFILEAFKLNGEENSYVDFYYYSLQDDDKKKLKEFLSKDEKDFLEANIKNLDSNTIYFRLTEEFIPFLVSISLKEILFSTFYFSKVPLTIWTNYNRKFPIFFEKEEDIEIYIDLAKKYNLEIK